MNFQRANADYERYKAEQEKRHQQYVRQKERRRERMIAKRHASFPIVQADPLLDAEYIQTYQQEFLCARP